MSTTIQIIDDNVALTTLLAKTLARFGYRPVVENNPLLAINTARHYLPDLILLDVMMPERDGGRVLADLRADLSLRYIPVVLLTGIAKEAQALAETGGIRSIILSKPVQLKELLNTIEAEIERTRRDGSECDLPARCLEGDGGERRAGGQENGGNGGNGGDPFRLELPDFDGDESFDDSPGAFSSRTAPPALDFSFPERESR